MLAADALLILHFSFVLFVVLGLILVLIGKLLSWSWVRNPWFRITHLAAILVVVLQAWLGVLCPLTRWEMQLRAEVGETTYSGSFIAYWLDKFLYYQAPPWVFILLYTLFGLLVVIAWYWVRPRSFKKRNL